MKKRFSLVMENVYSFKEVQKPFEGGKNTGLLVVMMVSLVLLLSRAFFLQVVTGKQNRKLAEENKLEIVSEAVERGVIVDRNGEFLARNELNEKNELVRRYPLHEAAAHLIGYIGQPSEEELEGCGRLVDCEVNGNDRVGKTGIEKIYEKDLFGIKTESVVERSASGEEMRRIKRREGQVGKKLVLSIDGALQQKIFDVLVARELEKGEFKGAVVVSKVDSGQILALASYPSFDNNLFTTGGGVGKYDDVGQVLNDTKRKPMLNRAVGAMYPPGSVFKLLTALVGLEEKKVTEETTIEDTGEIKVGQFRYGNWYFDQYGRTEGVIDLKKALARSNDIFFYKVGEWVGVDDLVMWSKKFGLGNRSGLNWPGEAAGLLPNPLEKERRTGERWFLGNTYHLAIGQGDLLATPLQMNLLTKEVVSGKKCKPTLLLDEESGCESMGVASKNREIILEGMKGACSSGGTAFPFFNFSVPVACKTGTAQHGGEETLPHAWISAVVPKVKEEGEYALEDYEKGVVISVMLEESGEGSYEAGPVAKLIADFVVSRAY